MGHTGSNACGDYARRNLRSNSRRSKNPAAFRRRECQIRNFDSKHPNGYNFADGGQNSFNPQKDKNSSDSRKNFFLKVIGAKIAYYRTLRDMSHKELARKSNISVSTFSKIERGKYNDNISVSLLMDIAFGKKYVVGTDSRLNSSGGTTKNLTSMIY